MDSTDEEEWVEVDSTDEDGDAEEVDSTEEELALVEELDGLAEEVDSTEEELASVEELDGLAEEKLACLGGRTGFCRGGAYLGRGA